MNKFFLKYRVQQAILILFKAKTYTLSLVTVTLTEIECFKTGISQKHVRLRLDLRHKFVKFY